MKYYEVRFTITPYSADAADILSAMAGDAGFESFESTSDGLSGYVQQQLFDQSLLDAAIEAFPFEGTHIIYKVEEAEDRDWNEQWEQEGFAPIIVESEAKGTAEKTMVIHDGRHLPEAMVASTDLTIEIDAHLAFGTGTHETTRMICSTLLGMALNGRQVLDCGCGTGILGICALKLGAASCTAYDLDEWSVDNTRHNAVINHTDDRMSVMHGDATLLDKLSPRFDLVTANINRNILLQDMPRFVSVMVPKGMLILSGFYQSDCDLLTEKAKTLGLTLQECRHDGDWACMCFVWQVPSEE